MPSGHSRRAHDHSSHQWKLPAGEVLLRSIAAHFPDGAIYVFDRGLRFLVAEGSAMNRLGFSARDLEGKTVREALSDELFEIIEPRYRRVLAGESFQQMTTYEGRVFSSSYVPIRDEQSRVVAGMVLSHDITGRKQSEQLYRTLAANLPRGAAFVVDRDLRYVLAEGQALREAGMQPADLEGRTIWEALDPDLAETYKPLLYRALSGETLHYEHNSHGRYYVTHLTPLLTEGRINAALAVSYDITNRRRAEEALQASEKRLRDILNNLVALVGLLTPDGTLIEANLASLTVAGLKPEDVLGKPFEETYWWAWSRDAKNRLRASMEKAAAGQSSRYDEVIRVGEGVYRTIDFMIAPMYDENGNVSYLIPSAVDVTDRRQAEEALRESEATLNAVLDTLPVGLIIADTQGRIIRDNAVTREQWGIPPDTRSWEEYSDWVGWWPENGERIKAGEWAMARALLQGETTRSELVKNQKFNSSERRYLLNNASPLRDSKGRIIGGVAAMLDITDRLHAEQELRRLNDNLEQVVAERTELAEMRARQLRKLAVELIEAEERERRRVAGLLHDDIQQLLASARLQLQAAVPDISSSPALNSVEKLLEESLEKTRNLSHELSPAVLHHSGLVPALEWLSGQMHQQLGLQVELEPGTAQLQLSTPLKVFLFRAVQELLFNVVKHAGVGTAQVVLTSSDDSLSITVSDNGAGFDPGILDTITEEAGFGLLSIRERARSIGGSLEIRSSPGGGAGLTLTVPLALLDTGGTPSEKTRVHVWEVPKHTAPPPARGVTRVLVADDHTVMRQALIGMLENQPEVQVVGEASTGFEALELARSLHPDVIVMDVSMPEMDGVEATRRVKAELPAVRVISLSMYEDEQIARAMQIAGAEQFVSKTCSSGELLKAIYGMKQ